MQPITIYTAHCRGNKFNTRYPTRRIVTSVEELRDAMRYDQVFAEYNGSHRSIDDFISSDCLPFDCDNGHSDIEEEWKTGEDVEKAFPGVPFWLIYSKSHMKQKGAYGPRPRFHVIFPIEQMTDPGEYRKLKDDVIAYFPYFDFGAKDAARFFYGVEDPVIELHGGESDGSE